MVQYIILAIIFAFAVGYISRKIYRDFSTKDECAKGCASCDISKPTAS